MINRTPTKRIHQMVTMRCVGMTFQAIGDHFGVSGRRVQQIIRTLSHQNMPVGVSPLLGRDWKIVAMCNTGSSAQAVGRCFGLSGTRIRQIYVRHQRRQRLVDRWLDEKKGLV